VNAGHPAIRIEVIDSLFHTVAKGFGHMEEDLPRGLYTVKFSVGDASIEEPVALYPDLAPTEPVAPSEPLHVSAAMPLSKTSTTRDYHQSTATRISGSVVASIGGGANLMIFVRDLDRRGRTSPAVGLALLNEEGERLYDLGDLAETSSDPQEDAWAGINIELDPGFYILRLDREDTVDIEMPVYAFDGWRTQLFATRKTQNRGRAVRRPDLTQANILMNRIGELYESEASQFFNMEEVLETDLRLSELSRRALERGSFIASAEDMNTILRGKWRDPMGGLLGAHVYALRSSPDLLLLEEVIDNLSNILHDDTNPDLLALRCKLAMLSGNMLPDGSIQYPPLLRQSWSILTEASSYREELIPPDSLAADIAGRLWGSSAWMLWQAPESRDMQSRSEQGEYLERALQHSIESMQKILDVPDLASMTSRSILPGMGTFASSSKRFKQNRGMRALASALSRIGRSASRSTVLRSRVQHKLSNLSETRGPEELLPQLQQMLVEQGGVSGLEHMVGTTDFTQTEFQVLSYVLDRIREQKYSSNRRRRGPERKVDPYAMTTLVRIFQLPASLIRVAVDTLFLKIMSIGIQND
jgi:hypothetical protein